MIMVFNGRGEGREHVNEAKSKAIKAHTLWCAPLSGLEKIVYPLLACIMVFLLVVAGWNAGILVGDIEGGGGPLQYVVEPLLIEWLD